MLLKTTLPRESGRYDIVVPICQIRILRIKSGRQLANVAELVSGCPVLKPTTIKYNLHLWSPS